MKAAILVVSKPSLSVNQAATNRLKNFLYDKNIEFVSETKTTTKETETIFSLEYSKNMADYVFVLVDKKSYSAFKNAFCKFFLTDVSENSFAKTFAEEMSEGNKLSKEALENIKLPKGSKVIKNPLSTFFGFIFTINNKEFIVMPNDDKEVSKMLEESVALYVENCQRTNYASVRFKTFDITEEEIMERLEGLTKNKHKILISADVNGEEGEVILRHKVDVWREVVKEFEMEVLKRLKPYIYTDMNLSIDAYALELLKIRNKKVSFVENITKGNVANYFLNSKPEAGAYLNQALVIATREGFEENFGIDMQFLKHKRNEDIAYEVSLKLLEYDPENIVVCVYGSSVQLDQLDVAIAIADKEQVLIYNVQKVGSPEEIDLFIKQTTLYYLIKKIKN